jgi:hypothetical protein
MEERKHISTATNPNKLGDLVSPWDQYWSGQIPLSALPTEMQDRVRALLRGDA